MSDEIDWFYLNKKHKLICLSVIISGLLGWLLIGGIGCLFAMGGTLCLELIWWATG